MYNTGPDVHELGSPLEVFGTRRCHVLSQKPGKMTKSVREMMRLVSDRIGSEFATYSALKIHGCTVVT